jgi:hypothetical protein
MDPDSCTDIKEAQVNAFDHRESKNRQGLGICGPESKEEREKSEVGG